MDEHVMLEILHPAEVPPIRILQFDLEQAALRVADGAFLRLHFAGFLDYGNEILQYRIAAFSEVPVFLFEISPILCFFRDDYPAARPPIRGYARRGAIITAALSAPKLTGKRGSFPLTPPKFSKECTEYHARS